MAAQEQPAQQAAALLVALLAALLVVQQAVARIKTQYQLAVAPPEEVVEEVAVEELVADRLGEVVAHKSVDIPAALAAGLLAHHKLECPARLYLYKLVELAVANMALHQLV